MRIAVLAVIAGLLYLAYGLAFPSGTIRYRLTVEVMADGKLHAGSGVIEVTYTIQKFGFTPRVIPTVKGEAVVVDLGDRGPLFVLLDGKTTAEAGGYRPAAAAIPAREFFHTSIGSLPEKTVLSLGTIEAKAEIPLERMPMMVRFADLSDPKSVTEVDPVKMSTSYGGAVYLSRMAVEATSEPISRNVDALLPWLATVDTQFDGQRYHRLAPETPFPNSLNRMDFKR